MTHVQAVCPKCKTKLKAPVEFLGKTVRCSTCEGTFTVPRQEVAAIPTPPPPPVHRGKIAGDGVKACPFCGEIIRDIARKCKHCGEFIGAVVPAGPIVDTHPSYQHTSRRGASNFSPGVAALLSFVIPGAGQIYREKIGTGLFWFFIVLIGYVMFILPGIVLHIICIVAAARD